MNGRHTGGPGRRKLIRTYVRANPGIGLRELARATCIPASSVIHHVTILKRQRLLVEARSGRRCILFDVHAERDGGRSALLQRDANLRALWQWIAANPGKPQNHILDAMQGLGWSRSTAQYRLHRLTQASILVGLQEGHRRIYHAQAPLPSSSFSLHAGFPLEESPGRAPARGHEVNT
jgi:predicted transcriptional regulator